MADPTDEDTGRVRLGMSKPAGVSTYLLPEDTNHVTQFTLEEILNQFWGKS